MMTATRELFVHLSPDERDALLALVDAECSRLGALPRPERVAGGYGVLRILRRRLITGGDD